jgi:D-arginine dehydrogenase
MKTECNVLIVGASAPSVALAARLASCGRKVILVETEASAPCCEDYVTDPLFYPSKTVRALLMASSELCCVGPKDGCDKQVLHMFGCNDLEACVDKFDCCIRADAGAKQMEHSEICAAYPCLSDCDPAQASAAICVDAKLVSGTAMYWNSAREFLRCGGRMCFEEELLSACYGGGGWTATTSKRTIRADVIINCAGSSANEVARRCDVRRLRIASTMHTCLDLALAQDCEDLEAASGPLVCWEVNGRSLNCDFRCGSRVILSMAGPQTCLPCAAEPCADEIGTSIVCFEECAGLEVDAGSGPARTELHCSAADGAPVIGWAREAPGFFWCVAMGQFGVACAPAVSALASDMIQNRAEFSEVLDRYGIRKDCACPDRLEFVGVVA